MSLFAALLDSPVGTLLIVVDGGGALRRCELLRGRSRFEIESSMEDEVTWSATECAPAITGLQEYFAGSRNEFTIPCKPSGTPFQRSVWSELQRIPHGTTISYQELARRVGNSKAARAAGSANGANPIAIVIPCHRVIGANGSLTGYAGGLEMKRSLLALEAGWSDPAWVSRGTRYEETRVARMWELVLPSLRGRVEGDCVKTPGKVSFRASSEESGRGPPSVQAKRPPPRSLARRSG